MRRRDPTIDRRETIEETAELRDRAWAARALPSPSTISNRRRSRRWPTRIRDEHGRIDVLVNDIWGAEVLKGGPPQWNTPIWKLDLQKGLRILRLGIETHLVTSHYLLPLLVAQPGGLLGRSHRRHRRLQRAALPDLGVLRPRQAEREPSGLLARPTNLRLTGDGGWRSRRAGCARR